jgi:hypothetical protein
VYISPETQSFALTCGHDERALVPCSFWQLQDMTFIDWNFDTRGVGTEIYNPTPFHFEACADEVGARMPSLVHAKIITSRVTGALPPGLFQSPKLTFLSIDGVPVESLPPFQMPDLAGLVLINNNLAGPIRSFAGGLRLEEIVIQKNLLLNAVGGATASCFDNCPKLKSVVITDTEITEFFSFAGSNSIVSIDLSHNQIDALLPDSWSHLVHTETLDLSYNNIRIINPNHDNVTNTYPKLSPLKAMTKIASVDLSHNEIRDEFVGEEGMRGFLTNTFTSDLHDPSIGPQQLDLSHNKLYTSERAVSPLYIGPGTGRTGLPSAINFIFHHNRLAGVFDIRNADTCRYNFDGSYNRAFGVSFGDGPEGQGDWCYGRNVPAMRMVMSNQASSLEKVLVTNNLPWCCREGTATVLVRCTAYTL